MPSEYKLNAAIQMAAADEQKHALAKYLLEHPAAVVSWIHGEMIIETSRTRPTCNQRRQGRHEGST